MPNKNPDRLYQKLVCRIFDCFPKKDPAGLADQALYNDENLDLVKVALLYSARTVAVCAFTDVVQVQANGLFQQIKDANSVSELNEPVTVLWRLLDEIEIG